MKARRRYASKRRPASRRWHIPPALIHGSETLEGGAILEEWGNALGAVLWQAFRDVMLWSNSEPAERVLAFSDSARRSHPPLDSLLPDDADARLRNGLKTLQQLVSQPGGVREDHVARACRQLSEWADQEGRLQTALAFAQNAALAAHSDPGAAFWVGTVAVRLNDHARAEVWFRRAIGLARRSRDWRMYSRAFGGLGNLYMRRGNLPAARRLHTRALRGARRGGMRREQAAALHDLFAVAVETAQPAEAERLARQALEAYGLRSGRVHVLAHDVAYFWMEQGHFRRALTVFQAVLPVIKKPMDRLFVLADLVRAAGGTGDTEAAEAAAEQVWRLITEPDLESGAARALLEAARGYVSLRAFDKARAAAEHAIRYADKYREMKVRFAAESLLDSMQDEPVALTPAPAPPGADASLGDQLAADFVRTMETIAGATQ